ncbi:3-dehydroquinate synthase [Pollutibacter soli]|uniref:3-dehydroquinate synthase n=1 Tax=Pollutibacter soli TaxID=3034157 RepID=UPI003013F118
MTQLKAGVVKYKFSTATVNYYFNSKFSELGKLVSRKTTVLITDENIYRLHESKFKGWNSIVLKPGEEYKVQATVDSIIEQLIVFEADRNTTLIGIGGGVISDLTGYTASIYMRGIRFGFVPSTLLSMVDAAIGGKNGIDVGEYKNMVGIIRQPEFLLFDTSLLQTLPEKEWSNGFAEVIKHACIRDAAAFRLLEKTDIDGLKKDKKALSSLIERNARLKSGIVQKDEFEKGERKLLNFGHTIGHAVETQYELMHGEAVAIGMTCASRFSELLLGFNQTERITNLLEKYKLPTWAEFDAEKVLQVLKMDKKRSGNTMNFILLKKIGEAVIVPIPLKQLEKMVKSL